MTDIPDALPHERWALTIEDNGKGLPNHTGDIIHTPSLGMVGMRARARQSGGELTAISICLKGCELRS